jgi:arylsulfatase
MYGFDGAAVCCHFESVRPATLFQSLIKSMRRSLITLLALFWSLGSVFHGAEATAAKPNIIVILSDDMGYSDLGCFGGEIRTPNLDRLAANGLRYTRFYNTGRCCPTRASLLTGLYAHQAGIGEMTQDGGPRG